MCQAFLCDFGGLSEGLEPTYLQRLRAGIKADWAVWVQVIACGGLSLIRTHWEVQGTRDASWGSVTNTWRLSTELMTDDRLEFNSKNIAMCRFYTFTFRPYIFSFWTHVTSSTFVTPGPESRSELVSLSHVISKTTPTPASEGLKLMV